MVIAAKVLLTMGVFLAALCLNARGVARPFTVADDIGVSYFGIPYSDDMEATTFSPDGQYFVVSTTRGVMASNSSESTLRVYRTGDVRHFLLRPEIKNEPVPIWTLRMSAFDNGRYGSVIGQVRWLANSRDFAFLAWTSSRKRRLFLANVVTKSQYALTPINQDVDNFDIRDAKTFTYLALSPRLLEKTAAENRIGNADATGRSILELMFPEDVIREDEYDLAELWAVVNGKRFRINDQLSRRPLPFHSHFKTGLALSPGGDFVVVPMVVKSVPDDWVRLYLSPFPSDPYAAKGGKQDPDSFEGRNLFSEFSLVNVKNGAVKALFDAPTGESRGWWGPSSAEWSSDGKWLGLTNTFIPPGDQGNRSQGSPCEAAIFDIKAKQISCIKSPQLRNGGREVYLESEVHFDPRSRYLTVKCHADGKEKTTTRYERDHAGSWTVRPNPTLDAIDLSVHEDLNTPPVLVATDRTTGKSRPILDPNPQLKGVEFGEASVLRWKDKTGRDWVGGLFKPPGYDLHTKYPLVIQTHGFDEHRFVPSGVFPSAFAARALAASGILVLQVPDCDIGTPNEGPCHVAGFESGIDHLVSAGLVDPGRVGIVGFSRTCYAVLEALTTSKFHFAAASITDGVDMGYFQYLSHLDVVAENQLERDFEKVNGGAMPFASGINLWLERAPDFHLDKVTTPLLIVAHGRLDLLEEWEPYAALRLMNKPTDLILLTQRGTHVLSNPRQRLISQGGTVDWMRFWLQTYQDQSPEKAGQYRRWTELQKLRDEALHPLLQNP